uniref:Cytokine receptor-like factor 2 n=1 Tax=Sphenodon punctatus TaxID=8508 RepID=A0A8D0L3B8_SPHPU
MNQTYAKVLDKRITAINLNGELMNISWSAREHFPNRSVTFLYKFGNNNPEWTPCPHYLLDQGYNTGFLFKAQVQTLFLSIKDKNGSEELLNTAFIPGFYVKPNPPENVTFQWKNGTVAVYLSAKQAGCLDLEVQYISKFDKDWQQKKLKCCKVEVQGFYPMKCYSFRVRLERRTNCNIFPSPSEWGAMTFWKNGKSVGSCIEEENINNNNIILISVMAVLFVIFLLLVSVCKL